ncbi:MAG: hypothetical protein ABIG61_16355 [Planctomycetota bacterium]
MNCDQLEKYSSAITLSDMEVFVFPELMYALVLANIMSPVIWKWREDDSFKKLAGKSPYKKFMRLKQYVMDNYEFNLDLETWGLTEQHKELKRFQNFISPEDIAGSNALFGYHGDKYYFDVDIRRHFGLDKYDSNVIPYWKTETVEAMNAFRHKPDYSSGAGECVSLATLYAAAAFIVCDVPFEDIYMILTPLHSQNFIDIQDGILTNNRRIVTRTMWFNGTALSGKAQRALRNEQVTIVAHSSGYVHCMYKDATIHKNAYEYFRSRLAAYLSTELSPLIMANFLRANRQYQQYFQFCQHCRGEAKFIKAEDLFHYEHGSNFRIADETFEKLLDEIEAEDYSMYKLPSRICCEDFAAFIKYENVDVRNRGGRDALIKFFKPLIPQAEQFTAELADFVHTDPKLPNPDKHFVPSEPIKLSVDQSREQIIEYLQGIRSSNQTADLAFYAYRDMDRCNWQPFIKAAIERNPVSIEETADMSIDQITGRLERMENISIYDANRLAQPDEVINYRRGDGIEKALLLANVIHNKIPDCPIELTVDNSKVLLKADKQYSFASEKKLKKQIRLT